MDEGAAKEVETPTRVPEFTCDFDFKVELRRR